MVKSNDPGLAAHFAEESAVATRESAELQKKIVPLLRTSQEKQAYEQAMTYRTQYLAARDAIYKARKDGKSDEAAALFFVRAGIDEMGDQIALHGGQRHQQRRAGQGHGQDHDAARGAQFAGGRFQQDRETHDQDRAGAGGGHRVRRAAQERGRALPGDQGRGRAGGR